MTLWRGVAAVSRGAQVTRGGISFYGDTLCSALILSRAARQNTYALPSPPLPRGTLYQTHRALAGGARGVVSGAGEGGGGEGAHPSACHTLCQLNLLHFRSLHCVKVSCARQ